VSGFIKQSRERVLPKNTLTFNPEWDGESKVIPSFTDVRELQRRLNSAGIDPILAADETTSGPAHLIMMDPDGNPVLIDQHV